MFYAPLSGFVNCPRTAVCQLPINPNRSKFLKIKAFIYSQGLQLKKFPIGQLTSSFSTKKFHSTAQKFYKSQITTVSTQRFIKQIKYFIGDSCLTPFQHRNSLFNANNSLRPISQPIFIKKFIIQSIEFTQARRLSPFPHRNSFTLYDYSSKLCSVTIYSLSVLIPLTRINGCIHCCPSWLPVRRKQFLNINAEGILCILCALVSPTVIISQRRVREIDGNSHERPEIVKQGLS